MAQGTAVLAAHAVARQLDPAGILSNSRGRPGSACRGADGCSDSSGCSDAETAAAAMTHVGLKQHTLGLECIGEDHAEQYPHFSAWLHTQRKKRSPSTVRPCSAQPTATRSSSSRQQRTTTSHSSRPASAASSLQISGQLASGPRAPQQQHASTCKSSASGTFGNADVSCRAIRASQSTCDRAASRPSSRAASSSTQQQQQQCRSNTRARQQQQQQQARLQQPQSCTGSSVQAYRPQSAAVSGLSRSTSTPKQRPHTVGWLAEFTTGVHQQQEQGRATTPAWPQSTADKPQQGAAATQQQHQLVRDSSSNPWALFGADAPGTWQQLDTSTTRGCSGGLGRDLVFPSTNSMQTRLDIRPDSSSAHSPGTAKTAGLTRDAFRSACGTPDGFRQRLQQQQQLPQDTGYPRAAVQLFQQLPLSGNASMNRQGLQVVALGLQWALQQAGAPLQLQLPQYGCGAAAGDDQELDDWNAFEQLAPELRVWDALLAELCRQAHAECSQRGTLLLSAVTRQQQLLRSALSACDGLHSAMQQAAATAQQQEDSMAALTQQLKWAQQQNEQLTAALAVRGGQLDSAAAEVALYKERLRKGRFHIIAEQVQQAKVVLQQRMLADWDAQLEAAKLDWQHQEAAARSAWQQQLMQEVGEALGPDAADSLRLCMPQAVQPSTDSQGSFKGDGVHKQQVQAEGSAAALEAAIGCSL